MTAILTWLGRTKTRQHVNSYIPTQTTGCDPKKTEHLLLLDGAKERLQLFEVNLMEEGSFDPVVAGSEGVFHSASPVILSVSNPQAELIDPAVKGIVNVLRSCARVPSIKRVVVTSSLSTVSYNKKPLNPDVIIDETWFSDPVFCEESKHWFPLSRTLAEEAAWKFARENGIDLLTINPGYVIGPLLQPTLNITVEAILNLIKNGTDVFHDGVYHYVDVRDVAYAHIRALEIPSANGRYCLVGTVTYSSEVLNILHKLYPALNLSERGEDKRPTHQVSKKKAEILGINFTPLEVTLKDTVEYLKENNFLSF